MIPADSAEIKKKRKQSLPEAERDKAREVGENRKLRTERRRPRAERDAALSPSHDWNLDHQRLSVKIRSSM